MLKEKLTSPYMWFIAATGLVVTCYSLYNLQAAPVDSRYLVVAFLTIVVSSAITIQIPLLSGQITVGDTFIFLTALLFGLDAAVLLAAIEGACTSLRVYKKPRTIFFNTGSMALVTFLTVNILEHFWGPITSLADKKISASFISALCMMALMQFGLNSGLAAVASACKTNHPSTSGVNFTSGPLLPTLPEQLPLD